jgi:transglycosylase-like protein
MHRTTLLVLACCAALAVSVGPAPGRVTRAVRATRADHADVMRKIAHYRTTTWRLETLAMLRRTPSSGAAWRVYHYGFRVNVLTGWRKRAAHVWRRVISPPFERHWECIHRGEGAWNSNTGNGYYGGLQMDMGFQRTYAPDFLLHKGTADRWTRLEQIWVAERARKSGRGFYPWPTTARACGLI